jgi:hypothetical protein
MTTLKALFWSLLFCFSTSLVHAQEAADDTRKIQIILEKAQETDRLVSEALENVSSQRKRIEEDLIDAEDNPDGVSKEIKKAMNEKVKAYRREESELTKKRKATNDYVLKVSQIVNATPKKQAGFVVDYERKNGVVELTEMADNQQVKTETPEPTTASTTVTVPPPTESTPPSVSEPEPTASTKKKTKKERDTKKSKQQEEVENTTPTEKTETETISESEPTVSTKKKPKKERTTKKPKPQEEVEKAEATEKSEVAEVATDEQTEVLKGNLSGKKDKERAPKKTKKETTKKTKKADKDTEIATGAGENPQNTEGGVKMAEPNSEGTSTPSETISTPSGSSNSVADNDVTNAETGIKDEKKKRSRKEKADKSDKNTPSVSVGSTTNYKAYDIKTDVIFNPPAPECALVFDGVDEFTGKKKRETATYRLFSQTDDIMRAAMKDKEFITCDISATRVEGAKVIYMALTFTIQTKEAQKSFGFLDRGAFIIFRLINGKKLTFETAKTDIGIIDIDKGTTTYRAQINVFDFVELTSSELDAVRVAWSAGYEDYEVYDLDVLKNMLKCLDKK